MPGTPWQGILLDAVYVDAAERVAVYPRGRQIMRVTAAVIYGCHPLLPRRVRVGRAMLHIASTPAKSVDRTCIYETFTISTSKSLVNLKATKAA
jgi:hypothetical protein